MGNVEVCPAAAAAAEAASGVPLALRAVRISSHCPAARTNICKAELSTFLPLAPATLGHSLVIPKVHYADLWQLPNEAAGQVMDACLVVSRAVRDAFAPEGLNLINSAGEVATQTVFHVHFHVVPRWRDDHIGRIWPPAAPWSDERMERVADAIIRCVK